MRTRWISAATWVLAALVLAAPQTAAAGEKSYQKGVLLQMESAPCGFHQKGGKGITGAILGTDSEDKKTREMLCQEYVLQADRITYRIRPKDEKKPVLLPVGETVQFRIDKDKLKLRVPEGDNKERDYLVLSMTPRSDVQMSKKDPCKD